MSRQLPPNPNLEFLKKQAKDRLESLRLSEPGAKLADALHATACDYGFTNWATLKAHVESVQQTATRSPFFGTWIARHDLVDGVRPSTLEFGVEGNVVTITDVAVDGAGRERRGTNTLTIDGADHPSGHGYAVAASWKGSRGIEAVGRRDGRLVGRVVYEVSADGATLTVASEAAAHDGYPASKQVAVFTRA